MVLRKDEQETCGSSSGGAPRKENGDNRRNFVGRARRTLRKRENVENQPLRNSMRWRSATVAIPLLLGFSGQMMGE